MSRSDWTAETLVVGVLAGEPRALARAISLVEDGDPDAYELVRAVYPQLHPRIDHKVGRHWPTEETLEQYHARECGGEAGSWPPPGRVVCWVLVTGAGPSMAHGCPCVARGAGRAPARR